MSNDEANLLPEELEEDELRQLIPAILPEGPSQDQFWAALAGGGTPPLAPEAVRTAVVLAKQALAIARGELTLGKYLAELRTVQHLSQAEVARQAKIAPDLLRDLETDAWPIRSVAPAKLVQIAVPLRAAKPMLIELVRRAPQSLPGAQQFQSTLRREDSYLDRSTSGGVPLPHESDGAGIEEYVVAVEEAFDALARSARGGAP